MTDSKHSFAAGLTENMFVIGVGSALTKLILFALLPILTRELTPKEYAISELLTNTVNLLLPFFSLIIFEAILRYSLEFNNIKEEVLAVGLRVTSAGICILMVIALFFSFFSNNILFIMIFMGMYIICAYKNCFVYYARGKNRFILITVISIIEVVILLAVILVQAYIGSLTLIGYMMGNLLSGAVCVVLYVMSLNINILHYLKLRNKKLEKDMVLYSIPMIFNSLGWWLNNVSDRYMLMFFRSLSLTGIYAISYKLPGILNTVVDVFMQAWKVSATEEYETGNTKHYIKGYEMFVYASFLTCSVLIALSKRLSFLFGSEYKTAWKYSAVLIIAFLFNGISGYLGTVFIAVKQTKCIGVSTLCGAFVNVVFNLLLITKFGAMGAAVATVVSNMVILGIRGYFVKLYVNIRMTQPVTVILFVLLSIEAVLVLLQCRFVLAIVILICIISGLSFAKGIKK